MSPAWHFLTVPDAKPKISATLAGLGVGDYDGHVGHIRIGSGVDSFIETFLWDINARAGAGGWVGGEEHIVLSTDDAWALDWSRQPLSAIRGAWARPNGGVGWSRSGAAAYLRSDVTVPASGSFTLPIHDYGATTLPPQGNLTTRGMTFAYTGVTTTAGSAAVTGVTGGTPGVLLPADYTPLIPYAPSLSGGGDPGGWGTVPRMLRHVGEMWTAGFRLEERIHAWMNGSQDNKSLQIAPFYLNYNIGDDFTYPDLGSPPPSGLLGPGLTLLGPPLNLSNISNPGTGTVIDERAFQWVEQSWTTWTPAAPTKDILVPVLYGKMPVDAADNGQAYGVTLSLRWMEP